MTRESYVNRTRKLSYKGFKIEEITVLPSGDQATVKVRIDISYMGYNFKGAPQTQNWVKEKGEWFVKSGAAVAKRTPLPAAGKAEITVFLHIRPAQDTIPAVAIQIETADSAGIPSVRNLMNEIPDADSPKRDATSNTS